MNRVALRAKDLAVLCATLGQFATVREARVFGSRATGGARRASDLDLAVSAPDATAAEWDELCDALENAPLIYELDIVRLDSATNRTLQEKIKKGSVAIYSNPA